MTERSLNNLANANYQSFGNRCPPDGGGGDGPEDNESEFGKEGGEEEVEREYDSIIDDFIPEENTPYGRKHRGRTTTRK